MSCKGFVLAESHAATLAREEDEAIVCALNVVEACEATLELTVNEIASKGKVNEAEQRLFFVSEVRLEAG